MDEVHRMLDQIINEPRRIAQTTDNNVKNLKKRIIPIIIPTIILIISSLIILIFTNAHLDLKYPFTILFTNVVIDKELLISINLSFLVILSIYCLLLLALEIKRLLTYEVRER